MPGVILKIIEDGTTARVQDIIVHQQKTSEYSIEMQVNGRMLDPQKIEALFNKYRHNFIVSEHCLKELLRQPLPPSWPSLQANHSISYLRANTDLTRDTGLNEIYADFLIELCHIMDAPIVEASIEVAKELSAQRLDIKHLYQLNRKAFKREFLKRHTEHGILSAFLNEKLFWGTSAIAELHGRYSELSDRHPGKPITAVGHADIWSETALKYYTYYQVFNSAAYTHGYAALEKISQHVFTRIGARLGIAAVHPILASAFTAYASAHLVSEYGEPIWDGMKLLANQVLGAPCYAQAPTFEGRLEFPLPLYASGQLGTESADLLTQPNLKFSEQAFDYEDKTEAFRSPLIAEYELKGGSTFFLRSPDSLFVTRPPSLTQAFSDACLPEKVAFFSKSPLDIGDKNNHNALKLQQIVKAHVDQPLTQPAYSTYSQFPISWVEESVPHYQPGQRASLEVRYEGGKIIGFLTVNAVQLPYVAATLLVIDWLRSQIAWHSLSSGDKENYLLDKEMKHVQAAQEQDYTNWYVLWNRLTGSEYKEIEQYSRGRALQHIERAIETEQNPESMHSLKIVYYALKKGDDRIFTNPKVLFQEKEEHLHSLCMKLYEQLGEMELRGAQKSATELKKFHPYDVGACLVHADFCIAGNNLIAAEQSLKKAKQYLLKEKNWVETAPRQITGHYVETLEDKLNHVGYRYHLAQYKQSSKGGSYGPLADFKMQTALSNLLAHTEQCFTANPNNEAYRQYHLNALLLAKRITEALTLCNSASSYCKVAHKVHEQGDLTWSIEILEQGLAERQYDSELEYRISCLVRNHHLSALEQAQSEREPILQKIGAYAKKAYQKNCDTSGQDAYIYGVSCRYLGKLDEAYLVLNQFLTMQAAETSDSALHQRGEVLCLLGGIDTLQHKWDQAKAHYQHALKLNSKNLEACISLGQILFKEENYNEANHYFLNAVTLEPQNKIAQQYVQTIWEIRCQMVQQFTFNIGFKLGLPLLYDYLVYADHRVPLTLLQASTAFGDVIHHSIVSKGMDCFPQWKTMSSFEKLGYATHKIGVTTQIIDQVAQYWNYSLSKNSMGIHLQNGIKCVQTSIDLAMLSEILIEVNTDTGLDYTNLAVFTATRGLTIGEALVRGGYRVLYGEYMPRPENYNYLMTKHFASTVGTIASIELQCPGTLLLLQNGIQSGVECIFSWSPIPIPIDPATFTIIVGGAGLIYGVYRYAESKAWYEKFHNLQHNAQSFAAKNAFNQAIGKLNECLAMKPDGEAKKQVQQSILAVSKKRLATTMTQTLKGKETLSSADIRIILNAYDIHERDTNDPNPDLQNERKKWLLEEYVLTRFDRAKKLIDEKKWPQAFAAYHECSLHPEITAEQEKAVRANIAYAAEQRLIPQLNQYAGKELGINDLENMIHAHEEYLQDVPTDTVWAEKLSDLRLFKEILVDFNQAKKLLDEEKWSEAISVYQQCLSKKLNEEQKNSVRTHIAYASEHRLIPQLNQYAGKELGINDLENMITVVEVHLQDVPTDTVWTEKLSHLRLSKEIQMVFNQAKKLIDEEQWSEAISVYQQCLSKKLNEEQKNSVLENITYVSELRLTTKLKSYFSESKEETYSRGELADLEYMIRAYEEHLCDVPLDILRSEQLVDLRLSKEIQEAFKEGKNAQGIEVWEQYNARHPEDKAQQDKLFQKKCIVCLKSGQYEQALHLCQERLNSDHHDITALKCRAQLHQITGNNSLARMDLEVLLILEPNEAMTYQQLAHIECVEGHLLKAKRWIEQARALCEKTVASPDVMEQITEQFDVIQAAITSRWVRNFAQITSGILSGLVDCYASAAALPRVCDKPPLPYWTRCIIPDTLADEVPGLVSMSHCSMMPENKVTQNEACVLSPVGEPVFESTQAWNIMPLGESYLSVDRAHDYLTPQGECEQMDVTSGSFFAKSGKGSGIDDERLTFVTHQQFWKRKSVTADESTPFNTSNAQSSLQHSPNRSHHHFI